MSHEDWTPKPEDEPIVFTATRGDENLHVQVIGGKEGDNPALMIVVLEVRLGPDA